MCVLTFWALLFAKEVSNKPCYFIKIKSDFIKSDFSCLKCKINFKKEGWRLGLLSKLVAEGSKYGTFTDREFCSVV